MFVGELPSLLADVGEKTDAIVVDRFGSRLGSGCFRWMATVVGLTASILCIDLKPAPIGTLTLPLIRRSSENATASALNGVPSWNFTPWRSLKVSVRPSLDVSQEVASSGLILPCVSNATRVCRP